VPDGCNDDDSHEHGGRHFVPSELGESWLPFMESTSACLAAHEQQIESLQVSSTVVVASYWMLLSTAGSSSPTAVAVPT
jgi:hypothetical protein